MMENGLRTVCKVHTVHDKEYLNCTLKVHLLQYVTIDIMCEKGLSIFTSVAFRIFPKFRVQKCTQTVLLRLDFKKLEIGHDGCKKI